jgi:hypothetical protein
MTLRSRQRPVDRIDLSRTGPKVLAYGIGVDSTALLCGESISSYDVDGCRRRPATVENH